MSPEDWKVPSIHFSLIVIAIVASREGFRRACQRQPVPLHLPPAARRFALQRIVNMSWLAVPAGIFAAVVVCVPLVLIFSSHSPEYTYAVFLQALATVFENTREPVKSVQNALMRFRITPVCEAVAAVVGALTTIGIMKFGGKVDLTMFGYSQLAVAVTSFAIMHIDYLMTHDDDFGGSNTAEVLWRRVVSLMPARPTPAEPVKSENGRAAVPACSYFDTALLRLCGGYHLQTYQKVLNYEAQKLVLTTFASAKDQGVYGRHRPPQ